MYKKQALMMISAALLIAACGNDDAERSTTGAMADKASEATSAVADAAENVADEAKEMAADAADAVGNAATEVTDAASDMAGDAADAMSDAAGDAMDAAKDAADGAADAAAGAASTVAAAGRAAGDDDDPCTIYMEVGDGISWNTNSLSVPSSCENVTVTIEHTGQLPKAAMGHNWVLMPKDAVQEIGMAAITLSVEQNYVPEGDDRIVAATGLIGGGESTSVSFSLGDLKDGVEYEYVCTFPGHWSAMRGSFTVSG